MRQTAHPPLGVALPGHDHPTQSKSQSAPDLQQEAVEGAQAQKLVETLIEYCEEVCRRSAGAS